MRGNLRLGIISDTHGLLRPGAVKILQDCDHIVHAGDIGSLEILERLQAIGPLTAVRGNVDIGGWAQALPETEVVNIGARLLYVLHDLAALDLVPEAAGIHVVISGHSHRPEIVRRNGVLYLNPGSAGPRRFHLPISMAVLEILPEQKAIHPRLIDLAD